MKVVLRAIPVEKTKVTVTMMVSAWKVTSAELTIADILLALNLFMTVATVQRKVFARWKIPVGKIKEIVIMMLNALMNLSVG